MEDHRVERRYRLHCFDSLNYKYYYLPTIFEALVLAMPNWLSGLGSSRGELPCHCIFLILLCPFLLSSVASKMVLHSCGHSLMRQPRAERTFLMLLSTILMGRMGINAASRRRKTKRTKTPTAGTKFDSFQNHRGNSVLETSTDCDRKSRYDINFHLISVGTHARMHLYSNVAKSSSDTKTFNPKKMNLELRTAV